MDTHFRVLGIPRGCDEAALRKAFRQKALDFHPDRNPGGADEFKRVNEAYEVLQRHFKRNGGRDVPAPSYSSNAGSAFSYARQAHGQKAAEPPRRFTDEELFGSTPGGFSHERRGYCAKAYARFGARRNSNNVGGDNRNDSPKNDGNAPSGGSGAGTKEGYQNVENRWRQAHGRRVPVSGYSYAREGMSPFPPRDSTRSQQRHPPYERQSTSEQPFPFSGSRASGSPMPGPSSGGGTWSTHGVDHGNEDTGECSSSDNQSATKNRDSFAGSTYPSGAGGAYMSAEEIQREWERLMRDFEDQTSTTYDMHSCSCGDAQHNVYSGVSGSHGGNSMEEEEEDYVVHKKDGSVCGKCGGGKRLDRDSEKQRLNEAHMSSILEERIQLKKVLFTNTYTPDPADVALMSDSDVYALCEVLRDVEQRMRKVLVGRMTKGLCSRCLKIPKMQGVSIFSCGHTSVCKMCAATCGACPVCAAPRSR
uniref:Uncharacterized protein TCIL3000_1_1760 n=1 Tax=Trypanosoma congolense (strain IL3000) TaxID=1068625 RepID=G0UJ58_TRYCI|nr:unnamed protein product [Trypanosoma congolense IL3000]